MTKLLLLLLCLLVFASRAGAHAFLDHAEPPVGGRTHGPPAAVKLWFTEKLEPVFSTAQLFDSAGKQVATAHVDKTNASLLEFHAPKLPPGVYKVVWRVVSVDTHRTTGSFTFEVGA